ncbi:LacI family DNA-binding transcriptional regulator [Kocuria rosea]|uniref:LacI family transcriptional regulator n=1 Tax=Kocuria rosea TaxID=1275 RepID=A0A4R5YI74_KOCRO|nr:LacI family DNA-binding transcriptional regulator [Kocuria rosea]TDL44616.1 LacI family transcriptional regulator [Kocuria rosea]
MNTERTRAGLLGAGRPSPTLEDIATAAGVSRSTASRAINGGDRVSREAQAAVDAAVVELGYTPNRAARSLVTRRTSSIALVIPEPDIRIMGDPFFAVIVTGITDALRDTDVQLVLLMSRNGDDSQRALRYLRGGHVDGAIVVSHHQDDPWSTSLLETGLPAVFIGRPWDVQPGVTYVDTDNYQGGRLAARHLAAGGRTRIGTVAGPADMPAAADRLAGWREGLREAGLTEGPVVHGDFTTAGGRAAARQLLEDAPDVDAVFAASDLMALGVIEVLHERGRRVPEDVAVVGYDNHALSATAVPALTTITQPMSAMATKACELLLETVDSPGTPRSPFIYPAQLVVRESSGAGRPSPA